MKTLVTGATGFIGTYLVDALTKTGREVTCCIRKTSDTSKLEPLGVKLVYGDLLDKDSLKKNLKGMDCIFHLGGEVYCSNPDAYYDTNIKSTRNILDASLENKVGKIIFFSSIAAMGPKYNRNQRLKEEDNCHPVSPYGISKYMCEQLLCKFVQEFKLPVVIVRPPVVYGPGVNSSSRVLELIRNIKKGIVLIPGDGNNRISLCYVENLIKGTLLAEKRADISAKKYILTDSRSYTYNEIISAVTKELKIKVKKVFIPHAVLKAGINIAKYARKIFLLPASIGLSRLEEGIYSWDCDITRAREELNYNPDVALNEGLRKTIKWCLTNNLC